MPGSTDEQDPLDAQKNNPEAIKLIRQLYDVDDEVATDLWGHFIETVKKMRTISQSMQASQSEGK